MSYELIHGDCLEVLPTLEAGSVDCIITDLPYGVTACKWDSVIPFEPMWTGIGHVLRFDGAAVLFGGQPFGSLLVASKLEWFRYRWVWDKRIGANFQLANLQPMNTAEDIWVFSQAKTANGAAINMRYFPVKTTRAEPIKSGGKSLNTLLNSNNMVALKRTYHDKHPISILSFDKESGKDRLHPTQKPVPLLKYLIYTYTNPGETVLDFTMGSGSTGVACLNTGRRFVGIEKDARYFAIAQERLEATSQQLRLAV